MLSRKHHRLKTFGGWRDTQLADGTVVWTSPAGRRYRTSPAGADLFPQVCAAPAPRRRSRSQQRSARIARARRHNRERRPINDARRRLDDARKAEIAARKFRNHMRDMLFLFKGATSASPYAKWVNDQSSAIYGVEGVPSPTLDANGNVSLPSSYAGAAPPKFIPQTTTVRVPVPAAPHAAAPLQGGTDDRIARIG